MPCKLDFSSNLRQGLAYKKLTDNKTKEIGYGGGAGCFSGETLVLTSAGFKRIDSVSIGDMVLSVDEDGVQSYKKVIDKFKYGCSEPCIRVRYGDNKKFTATKNHEFLINNEWTPLQELLRRTVETSKGNRRKLLDKQFRALENNELEELKRRKNHEASQGQQRVSSYDDKTERKVPNNKTSQTSSSSIHTKPKEPSSSQSLRPRQNKQRSKEPRVVLCEEELSSQQGTNERIRQVVSKQKTSVQERKQTKQHLTDRGESKVYTRGVQAKSSYSQDVSEEVRSFRNNNQGRSASQELEGRELTLEEITGFELVQESYVYDLCVENNHNYTITKDCLQVHNSGKSFLGCAWVILMCLQHLGVRYLIGRRELTNLKKTTLKTFFETCKKLGLKSGVHYKYNGQMSTISFFNESEILLMDMAYKPSDPDYLRFGGLELTGAFVDESNECDIRAIDILSTRLGRCKNEEYDIVPKLYETFNPSKNHVYSRFWHPFKNDNMPEHRCFVRALATDNPFLAPSYIKQLEKADEVTRERLLYGNFDYDDDERALVSYKQIADCFSNSFVEEGEKYISSDLAMQGRDLFVVSTWNGLRCKFPLIMPKATGKSIEVELRRLAEEYSVPRSHVVADSDGMGQYLESYMEGIETFRANHAAFDKAYKSLKHECAFKLAEVIRKGELYLDVPEDQYVTTGGRTSRLRDVLIEELGQLKIDNASIDKDQKKKIISKDVIKQNIGRSPDFLDVLIMRMFWLVVSTEIAVLSGEGIF